MPLNLSGKLEVVLSVRDANLGPGLSKAEGQLQSFDKTAEKTQQGVKKDFTQIAGAFTSLFVARAIGQAIFGMLEPAVTFQEEMMKMGAATGQTGKTLQQMGKIALIAARETKFSPEDAIQGLTELHNAGLGASEGMRSLLPMMQFAQARSITVGEAAAFAGQIFKQFPDAAANMSQALGAFNVISRPTGLQMKSLADVMAKLGQATRLTGMDFTETTIAFALTARGFGSPQRAATDFNALLTEMGDPKKRAAIANAFNVPSAARGNIRNLNDLMVEIVDRNKGMSATSFGAALASAHMGRTAQKAYMAMFNAIDRGIVDTAGKMHKGADAIEYLRKKALGGSRDLAAASEAASKTFTFAVQNLQESVRGMFVVFGTGAVEGLGVGIKVLSDAIGGLTQAAQSNGALRVLGSTLVGLGTVFGSVVAASLALSGGIKLLQFAFSWGATGAGAFVLNIFKGIIPVTRLSGVTSVATGRIMSMNAAMAAGTGKAAAWGSAIGNAVAIVAAAYAGFQFGDMLNRWKASHDEATAAIMKDIDKVGYFMTAVNALGEAWTMAWGTDILTPAQQRQRAIEAATKAQEKLNEGIKEFNDLVRKAGGQRFPPRFTARDINEAADTFRRLAHEQGAVGTAARQGLAAFEAVSPILAKMQRGEQLSAAETARLNLGMTAMRNNVGLLGPRYDGLYDRMEKNRSAAAMLGTEENNLNRAIAESASNLSEEDKALMLRTLHLEERPEVARALHLLPEERPRRPGEAPPPLTPAQQAVERRATAWQHVVGAQERLRGAVREEGMFMSPMDIARGGSEQMIKAQKDLARAMRDFQAIMRENTAATRDNTASTAGGGSPQPGRPR